LEAHSIKRALFYANASTRIGVGHLVRCMTLASSLVKLGWKCEFICKSDVMTFEIARNKPSFDFHFLNNDYDRLEQIKKICAKDTDLFVIDDYEVDIKYENYCRDLVKRLLVIEDSPLRKHNTDYLLDQTYDRKPNDYKNIVSSDCCLLLGSKYILLRDEFRLARSKNSNKSKIKSNINNILVAISSTDPLNFTSTVIHAIAESGLDVTTNIIIANNAIHLSKIKEEIRNLPCVINLYVDIDANRVSELIMEADIGVGSGGISIWERCCLGLPMIVVLTADNQRHVIDNLAKNNVIKYLGYAKDVNIEKIKKSIVMLNNDFNQRLKISKNSFDICDGKGSERVAGILNQDFI